MSTLHFVPCEKFQMFFSLLCTFFLFFFVVVVSISVAVVLFSAELYCGNGTAPQFDCLKTNDVSKITELIERFFWFRMLL